MLCEGTDVVGVKKREGALGVAKVLILGGAMFNLLETLVIA